jgi:hypothetical protein
MTNARHSMYNKSNNGVFVRLWQGGRVAVQRSGLLFQEKMKLPFLRLGKKYKLHESLFKETNLEYSPFQSRRSQFGSNL